MPVPALPALGCSLREVTEPPRSSMALVISSHFLAVEVFSSPNEILSANSLYKIAKRGWSGGRRSQHALFFLVPLLPCCPSRGWGTSEHPSPLQNPP